jgi:RsiW-degrading membrane proteinase PrsW (M82 family)
MPDWKAAGETEIAVALRTADSKPSGAPKRKFIMRVPKRPTTSKPRTNDLADESSADADHAAMFGMEDGGDIGVGKALKEIKSLNYSFLIPLGKLFSPSLLRKRAVRWTLVFGLLPLVIWYLSRQLELGFSDVIWLMELYFCFFWAVYFVGLIQVDRAVVRRGIGYFFVTIIVGIPILFGFQTLPIVRSVYAQTSSYSFTGQLFGYVFGVGVAEELCKALPLLVFGLREKKITSIREGVFLGMLSGFGFAASEGVMYIGGAAMGAHFSFDESAVAGQFNQFLFRMVTGPLLHAAWAGTVGWFIGVAAVREGAKWPVVALGILAMAALHGVHDVLVGGWLGLLTSAFTLTTLFAYLTHGEKLDALKAEQQAAS